MATNDAVTAYFREIKSLLLCPKAKKEELLLELHADVEDFIEEHPEATIDDLKNRFGTPESIANNYHFAVGETEIRNKVNHKRKLAYLIGGGIAVLLLAAFIGLVIYFVKLTADVPEYYVVEESPVTSITEEEWEELKNDENAAFA